MPSDDGMPATSAKRTLQANAVGTCKAVYLNDTSLTTRSPGCAGGAVLFTDTHPEGKITYHRRRVQSNYCEVRVLALELLSKGLQKAYSIPRYPGQVDGN